MEEKATMDFPIYEIMDSIDENTPMAEPPTNSGNDPPIIRRSSRNVGPPKFYDKRHS